MGARVSVTLEPSVALTTCETALRSLMTATYSAAYGPDWLTKVAGSGTLQTWVERANHELRSRGGRGAIAVPAAGLSYANFYDLVSIAEGHWEPLAAALGKQQSVLPLLRRFDNLRNAVGHSRPLLPFERDLLSGIAGQIRNQVTIHMSTRDEAGDLYPLIESMADSFGRRIECVTYDGEMAGFVSTFDVILRPGDLVTFDCVGVDPQGRDLTWRGMSAGTSMEPVTAASGTSATLVWPVTDSDVNETQVVQIYMETADAKYHRFGSWDHRGAFAYRVRPPEVSQ